MEKEWKNKRAYFVQEDDGDYGVAVVAYTAREAKKLARYDETLEDVEWINLRVQWKKGVDIIKLPLGIIQDYLLALKLGIYGYVEYENCPICKSKDVTVYYDKNYYCSDCEDNIP